MSPPLLVRVRLLRPGAALPRAMTAGAAGLDLAAAIDAPRTLPPGARELVPCGVAMAIPQGFEGQVRPRSGLAHQFGVTVLNAPGTVDSDYRGELKVLLVNLGQQPFVIEPGARIAQLVIAAVANVRLEVALELDDTARGEGGYGSTNLAAPAVVSSETARK